MSAFTPEPETRDGGTRTFRGETLESVLRDVRDELGPEALVLRQREGVVGGIGGFFGKRCVEVDVQDAPERVRVLPAPLPVLPGAAAVDLYDSDPDDPEEDESALLRTLVQQASPFAERLAEAVERVEPEPEPVAEPEPEAAAEPEPAPAPVPAAVAEPVYSPAAVRRRLAAAGLDDRLAAEIVREAEAELRIFDPTEPFEGQVRRALARRIKVKHGWRGRRRVIALVGAAGSGKTLTAARLCHAYGGGGRRSVGALSLEPVRKALELGRHTESYDVELAVADEPRSLRLALDRLADVDVLVVDTPSVDPRDTDALHALGDLLVLLRPDETHLLVPARLDAHGVAGLLEAVSPELLPNRLLLTHLDGPGRVGDAVSVSIREKVPISFTARGSAWGLRPADPCELAGLVLP